ATYRNVEGFAALSGDMKSQVLLGLERLAEAEDVIGLRAVELQRRGGRPILELEREHAHPHQVAPVDALEALGHDGPHTKEVRPLRRPVARGTRAVLLAGDDHERGAAPLVLRGGVKDG